MFSDTDANNFGSRQFDRIVDSTYLPHNIPDTSKLGHGMILNVHQSLHCLCRKLKWKTRSFISFKTLTSIPAGIHLLPLPLDQCLLVFTNGLAHLQKLSFCLLQ